MFEKLRTAYKDEYEYISAFLTENGVNFTEGELLTDLDIAWKSIASYVWIHFTYDDIADKKANYFTQIVKLAIAYFYNDLSRNAKVTGENGITQFTLGSQSITFRTSDIQLDSYGLTDEVRASLPPARLRLL